MSLFAYSWRTGRTFNLNIKVVVAWEFGDLLQANYKSYTVYLTTPEKEHQILMRLCQAMAKL
jgi:hypothetical protein